MHKIYLALAFLILCLNAYAQIERKNLNAIRSNDVIKIDAQLNEPIWLAAPAASNFMQREPQQNIPASFNSEVKIVYDNEAIYISAHLFDPSPDSILHELSLRDNYSNTDVFSIYFDTYHDLQNRFEFGVTAAGVQFDQRTGAETFDVVWESATKIVNDGWIVEMKIPYSAIRFPDKSIQLWGLQINRNIRRKRELDVWQFIAPDLQNQVSYFGELKGIQDIKSPIRLSFTPYVGVTEDHFPYNAAGKSNWSSSYNAGLDLKYGINESFTLDMTLAPDFGQVQSDNKVLNLSAFEVEFQENRPFFIEGTELFNVGRLFYARRIGGTPKGYFAVESLKNDSVSIIDNPQQVQLINATKITGRSPGGLGIGFLNAVTAETNAIIKDANGIEQRIQTAPLTNYNVISLNQTLSNNSYVSLVNTNVSRQGKRDEANVSAIDFAVTDKKDRFKVFGLAALNQKIYSDSVADGFRYLIGIEKVSGNLKYGLSRNVESDTYNPNDLGLLLSPDEISSNVYLTYTQFKPNKYFLRRGWDVNVNYSTTYRTHNYQSSEVFLGLWHIYKKNWMYQGFSMIVKPVGDHDIYEARTPGRTFIGPNYYGGNTEISTDYRKTLAIDANFGYYHDFTAGGSFTEFNISPIWRISDKLKIINSFNFTFDNRNQGFAQKISDSLIYFAFRDVRTHVNTLSASYIFNKNNSLTFRARYYWSTVEIKDYLILQQDGHVIKDTTNFNGNNDRNVSFFNVDLIYRWRFAPGSDLILVWKNSVNYFANDISVKRYSGDRLTDSFYNTLNADQSNTFTLKVLYYLDYRYFMKKQKKV